MLKSFAILTDGKGHSFMEDIKVRSPKENEIIVQLKAAGICQTDLNKMNTLGEFFIPGHEGAGIVIEIGSKVSKVKEGDKVLLNWAQPCYTCYQCNLGNQNLCEINSPIVGKSKYFNRSLNTAEFNRRNIPRLFNLGTFSKHTIVQESAVTKIEVDIPYSLAGIVSCSVLTGYGSVVHTAKVNEGSSVAVIGCGGIGMNVIQSAKLRDAKVIVAIDSDRNRLALSKQFGATHQLLTKQGESDLHSSVLQLKELMNGRGVDYCFECTGIPTLSIVPLAMVRNGGTAIQISGVEQNLNVDMNLFEFDKRYINPLYGNCIPEKDICDILSLYQKKEYKLAEQVSDIYPIKEFQVVFDKIAKKEIVKGVFTID